MVTLLRAGWKQGLALGVGLLPAIVHAQVGTGISVTPGGGSTTGQQLQSTGFKFFQGGLFSFFATILNAILLIAGVIVLAYLIFGGFKYITAGGNAESAGEGRTAITNAIIGIIIIVAALALLSFLKGSLSSGNVTGIVTP